MERKLKMATIYNTSQTKLSAFPFIRPNFSAIDAFILVKYCNKSECTFINPKYRFFVHVAVSKALFNFVIMFSNACC